MIRANTNLNRLTHKKIRKIVDLTHKWAIKRFGVNSRRGVASIRVMKVVVNDGVDMYGVYNSGNHKIRIFKNEIKNVKMLIGIVLHEHTHSLQPIRSYYVKLERKYGYDNHPMEIEARNNGRYSSEVWKEIKIKIC